jgi:hypothetical protein
MIFSMTTLNTGKLSVNYAEWHYAECRYAGCHHAECHYSTLYYCSLTILCLVTVYPECYFQALNDQTLFGDKLTNVFLSKDIYLKRVY